MTKNVTPLPQPEIKTQSGQTEEVFVFPLSFAQQRLWLLHQLDPHSTAYNLSQAVRLKGALNPLLLERSLNLVAQRHEALRTTFSTVDEQPVQIIGPGLHMPLTVVDLGHMSQAEQQSEVQRWARQGARQPFDLTQGPLLRVKLLRLAPAEHVLLITMHHIISDAWSMNNLLREIFMAYQAFLTNTSPALPQLPIQYADYTIWQREWLQGDTLKTQLDYWRRQLNGAPARLPLPTNQAISDSPRSATQSVLLSSSLAAALKRLCQQENVTLFMTLLAAFKVLLHRYTNQDDFVIGAAITNRHRTELEPLIGFFVNTLALRTRFSGNPTFSQLLAQVRQTTLDAYAHQDLPFEKLVEELQPERNLERPPLFEVMVNFVNTPENLPGINGLTIIPQKLVESVSKFWMTLYITRQNDTLQLSLVYQQPRFSQERITCLLEQFQFLLGQIVTNPHRPINSYSLVTPRSEAILPNPADILPQPVYPPVTQMFAAWAERAPEQPAICQNNSSWSYSQLARAADTLAGQLLKQGLQPGQVVAVAGPPSFGLVAGMLAALKSGGVLLTLDPALPANWRQMMLQQAGAKFLLNVEQPAANEDWLQSLALNNIRVDPHRLPVGAPAEATLLPKLKPDDPAYIFFTSGTTGISKGVLGNHKGLSHFLAWQQEYFNINPADRAAQLTALSFDVVLRDIFLPLVSGARLCLPPHDNTLEPAQIIPWLNEQQVSVLHAVPSLAWVWLDASPQEISIPSLRRTFFAGEPLTDTLARRWRRQLAATGQIVNLYGPTETTMAKCYYVIPPEPLPGIQPVGNPLPQTQALVVNQARQLCGVGELGEIAIRTPFRTLGYINAAQEHQARFVKNQYREDEQDWLYFTGDLGRYRPDGSLEILGRKDRQVKIRGVRIEPDEIKSVLLRHPKVKDCVVTAQNNQAGQVTLVAYMTGVEPDKATREDLRQHAAQHLPPVMIPTYFVSLKQIPLTANGKVDFRALPPVADQSSLSKSVISQPRTAIEKVLAQIWAELLGLDQINIHDNFFELGGHSLLAMQVVSRIRSLLPVELPLRRLFESPTIAGLARAIAPLEAEQAKVEKFAQVLLRLAQLSEEEAEQMLLQESHLLKESGG